MKKFFCILLALLTISSFCFADGIDLSSMSDSDLLTLINSARIELSKRTSIKNGLMLYEDDNFSLYATGKYEFQYIKNKEEWFLEIEVIFENRTAEIAHVYSNTCVIDGWTLEIGQLDDTEPFTKLKDILYIHLPISDFPDPETISNIMVDLYVKLKESKDKVQLGKMYLSLKELSNQE